MWYVPGRGSGLSGSGFRFKFAFRVRGFGSTAAQGFKGSGFKGSGFRLFKVRSAVLAAQGLGFGVWGLGLKVQGSGFKGSGFRLRFRPQGSGQASGCWGGSQGTGFALQTTKADEANGHSIYYQRQLSNLPFYQANGRFMKPRQPVDNFIARRPFYRPQWPFYQGQ